MNNYGLRCSKCNKMTGVILSDYTVNIGDKCKILCPQCFIQHEDEPEILKCPCCGDLPMIYSCEGSDDYNYGYWCHCARYTCNFYYSVIADDKASAIKAWNEYDDFKFAAVIRYKETKNEQKNTKETFYTET